MKLSLKSDYAFRVLFTLVEHHGRGPISIRELAERNGVPKSFLEHIMLELKGQGWVASLPGKNGGYALAKHPDKITMGEIVRYFDGLENENETVAATKNAAYREPKLKAPRLPVAAQRFRNVMREVRTQAAEMMDRASLASVFAGMPVTRDEILTQEFGGGEAI